MTKVADICPQCGSHLIIKDGQDREFLACPRFPECRYTKSIRVNDTIELYKPPSLYCKKCNHTGLLPFIKNGKLIPYAFVDCECKLNIPEHFDPVRLQPEDFDFPMSDTFRGFSYKYCGQLDPGYLPALEPKGTLLEVDKVEPWAKKQWDIINQLRGMVRFLYLKETERRANASKRKPKTNTNKLTNIYKGRGGG